MSHQLNNEGPDLAPLMAEINRLGREIDEIEGRRKRLGTNLVAVFLPDLTHKVLAGLLDHHPDFLTADRRALFVKNLRTLGLFRPSGHVRALALLQAQFKAYLAESGQFSEVDRQIRGLMLRLTAKRDELLAADRAQAQKRSYSARRAAAVDDFDDFAAVTRATPDVEVGQRVAAAQWLTQAVAEETKQACTPATERATIATDDSLGCFS